MNDQKRNASQRLTNHFELPSWGMVLLLALLAMALGVALRSPVKNFPRIASGPTFRQIERDPYDLQSDRSLTDARNRVETGL